MKIGKIVSKAKHRQQWIIKHKKRKFRREISIHAPEKSNQNPDMLNTRNHKENHI